MTYEGKGGELVLPSTSCFYLSPCRVQAILALTKSCVPAENLQSEVLW
jgi:hypothetical protein